MTVKVIVNQRGSEEVFAQTVLYWPFSAGKMSDRPALCVCLCALSLQIGLWHSEDGLSMERTLPSINVTDTLFNTTLTITTILVSTTVRSHTHARAERRGAAPPPGVASSAG